MDDSKSREKGKEKRGEGREGKKRGGEGRGREEIKGLVVVYLAW